jgi:endonuclease YncB( thermonuclease family)
MELASRIISTMLGAAVMVFVLWPVTLPVGFGEMWRAGRQAEPSLDTPPKPLFSPSRQAGLPAAVTKAPEPTAAPSPHAVTPNEQTVPKPAQAPGEAAPNEQLAAVKDADKTGAVAPKASTKRYYRVTVRDGGTLQSEGVVIKLAGIAARDADATCKDKAGKSWPCGGAARTALTRLIRGRAVTCVLPKGGEHNIILARCEVAGTDLSTWLVRQGWAEAKDDKDATLVRAAAAAKAAKLGLWRSE